MSVDLPFTDVSGNFFFCQIAAAYFSGLTNGTTPTTLSHAANVTRDQNAVSVVRTSTGTILASLTGNGWDFPLAAAFDGERILITNEEGHSI